MNRYKQEGEVMKKWRKKRNLTQSELAELVSKNSRFIDIKYIGYLEQGRTKPSIQLEQKIRDVLNIPRHHNMFYPHNYMPKRYPRYLEKLLTDMYFGN